MHATFCILDHGPGRAMVPFICAATRRPASAHTHKWCGQYMYMYRRLKDKVKNLCTKMRGPGESYTHIIIAKNWCILEVHVLRGLVYR